MSDQQTHLDLAVESYAIAVALRDPQPAWALVPLFYSAMHLMHARFDADGIPEDQRHPLHHKSYRNSYGGVIAWGTLDVVRDQYMAEVSAPYSQLFAASVNVRYTPSSPKGDCTMFWELYEVLRVNADL